MVKILTKEDHAFLNEALQQAERMTSAKIALVVRPDSGAYRLYIMTYALILGSSISLVLWATKLLQDFPALLAIQLGTLVLCDCLHSLSTLFVCLVPQKVKHRRAARTAMREFHARHPQDAPFALLFISLAERYVHVVTNQVVHARIPEDWHKVTDGFARGILRQPLRVACAEAIAHIGQILSTAFPP